MKISTEKPKGLLPLARLRRRLMCRLFPTGSRTNRRRLAFYHMTRKANFQNGIFTILNFLANFRIATRKLSKTEVPKRRLTTRSVQQRKSNGAEKRQHREILVDQIKKSIVRNFPFLITVHLASGRPEPESFDRRNETDHRSPWTTFRPRLAGVNCVTEARRQSDPIRGATVYAYD